MLFMDQAAALKNQQQQDFSRREKENRQVERREPVASSSPLPRRLQLMEMPAGSRVRAQSHKFSFLEHSVVLQPHP